MALEWLDKLIKRAGDFKSVSPIMAIILQIVSDPDSSVADLEKAVSQDQALASSILRLVNSAFYSLPEPVSTVQRAVVLLGFNNVKSMALGMSLATQVNVQRAGGVLQHIGFWQHAIACAAAARLVAEKSEIAAAEEAFTAGLLHDIGKMLLNIHTTQRYSQCARWARQNRLPLAEAERKFFEGVDHAEIGRRLALAWNYPEKLVHAIGGHHRPAGVDDEAGARLATAVAVADSLCRALGVPSTYADSRLTNDAALWHRVGLGAREANRIMLELNQNLSGLWKMFGLPSSGGDRQVWQQMVAGSALDSVLQSAKRNGTSSPIMVIQSGAGNVSSAQLTLTANNIAAHVAFDQVNIQDEIARRRPMVVVLDLGESEPSKSALLQRLAQNTGKLTPLPGGIPLVVILPQQTKSADQPNAKIRLLGSPYAPRELLAKLMGAPVKQVAPPPFPPPRIGEGG